MKNEETIDCLICHSSNLETITRKGQFNIPINVCICTDCGLTFLNPRWDESAYLDFYQNEYDRYYRSGPAGSTQQLKYTYVPVIKRLENLVGKTAKFDKILDIGSGDGTQLSSFMDENKGNHYYAIEPSKNAEAQLKSKGIHFITNDINSDWTEEYKATFDLIIMRHVLEHFLRPDIVLEKIRRALKPNGLIYIAVPNAYKPKPPLARSFFRVVHTFYFNKVSLTNFIHKANYEILELVEGDKFLDKEIFVTIKKTNKPLELEIKKENYLIQKSILEEGLKTEASLSYKLKKGVNEIRKRIVGNT